MDHLAEVCEQVASYASRLRKVSILAEYFRTLDDADLDRAVRFLSGAQLSCVSANLFGNEQVHTLSIGGATLREAAISATGWDVETYRLCVQEAGDTGETIGLLVRDRTAGKPMTLARAEELYLELACSRQTAEKVRVLERCFITYRPLAIKYFIKVISGNLRIGLLAKTVEEAVAIATGVALDEVRAANNRLGQLATVALAARHGELHTIGAELFHPMDFMLAKPIESASLLPEPEDWFVEDKYDGIRSQIHFADGQVEIYTRGRDEVTHAFPEIESAMKQVPGSAVLDGELLAWRGDRAMAFTVLQQRLARKRVSRELIAGIPVVFMAYDILYRDGEMLVDRPLELRRAALEETLLAQPYPLMVSPQHPAISSGEIDRRFEDARLRGNEGLLLKRRGSLYESGKRSGQWYKLKRAYATLDVVVTAAEQGTGKRATVLSDYTFAVKSGESYLNVGKAYSGLTDEEIRELTRILRGSAVEKFGRVVLVRPQVVLEVAFDGIQKSPRHKGGFALRFPRIVRWRRDKRPEECDDLDRVQALYQSSLNLTAAHE